MRSPYLTYFLFLTSFFPGTDFAQLSLKLNLEGGYYQSNSKFTFESGQKDATFRADGEAGYKFERNNTILSIKLRARPELYGQNNNLKILKLKGIGNYYSSGEDLNWGFNITAQKNIYSGRDIDLNFKDLIIMVQTLLKLSNSFSMSINTGYGYQKISNDVNQKMDLVFLDAEAYEQIFGSMKSGVGIYSERFFMNGYQVQEVKNKGWRIGPHISLDYLSARAGLANFDYRFLFHISEFTKSPSYEHWIRLVAGKLLWEDWSVFLITDYYFRKYTITNNLINPYISLYTPLNEDNRIYLKFAYDFSDIFEIYLKGGYFRENLYNNYSFAGWNVLAGFEIEN